MRKEPPPTFPFLSFLTFYRGHLFPSSLSNVKGPFLRNIKRRGKPIFFSYGTGGENRDMPIRIVLADDHFMFHDLKRATRASPRKQSCTSRAPGCRSRRHERGIVIGDACLGPRLSHTPDLKRAIGCHLVHEELEIGLLNASSRGAWRQSREVKLDKAFFRRS